jgi:hypothetical protein
MTCTKNIPAFSSCYGKSKIGLPCSAPDNSCVVWRVLFLRSITCGYIYRSKRKVLHTYLGCFNDTSIKNISLLFVLPSHPITHPRSPRKIYSIYHTVWRHFQLRIHTNTYPVSSAVLLQLFTPRNHLQICSCKHFASAMETKYKWQSIIHQHLHYNQHQHCFLIYVILLHVKILPGSFLNVFPKFRKASINFIISVRPSILLPAFDITLTEFSWNLTFQNLSNLWREN